MSLVNTLTHDCTSQAVAADGVAIAYEDLGHGEPLAPPVGAFLGRAGAQNTVRGA
jgi:hypothetical protein